MHLIYRYIILLSYKGVELPNADGVGAAQKVDSLKRDVHDRDEEIRRLTNLLETKEEVAEGRGAGEEGRRGVEEVELSDVRAKLEEEKDSRMRAEELMNVQVRITWLFMTAFLVCSVKIKQRCSSVQRGIAEYSACAITLDCQECGCTSYVQ